MNYKLKAVVLCVNCEDPIDLDLDQDIPLDGQVNYLLQKKDWQIQLGDDEARCPSCAIHDDHDEDDEEEDDSDSDDNVFNPDPQDEDDDNETSSGEDEYSCCSCCDRELDDEGHCPGNDVCSDCD